MLSLNVAEPSKFYMVCIYMKVLTLKHDAAIAEKLYYHPLKLVVVIRINTLDKKETGKGYCRLYLAVPRHVPLAFNLKLILIGSFVVY
jgi:hypothetical protein